MARKKRSYWDLTSIQHQANIGRLYQVKFNA